MCFIHLRLVRYKQAEAKFVEALEEARLGFDAKDPHIASCMNNLAEFYRNTGQHDKARQLYTDALQQLESIYGQNHWLYASAMHNLALSCEEAGDLDAAESTMQQVMQLRRTMFGPRHFLYADSMFALGHILLKQAAKRQRAGDTSVPSTASRSSVQSGIWFGWGKSRQKNDVVNAGSLEKDGLELMQAAIGVLEDAGERSQVTHRASTFEYINYMCIGGALRRHHTELVGAQKVNNRWSF